MVGLQTYYHANDLRAKNERWDWEDPARAKETDVKPVYCGPGLWYDAATGHVHARLAHTHLPAGLVNYSGETDPRKLRLVIAPFRSVPLTLDGARHVRIQDLVIRGAGYDSVVIQQSSDIELDNLTVWAGSYGLRATGAQRLKVLGCGFYGSVPPWTFRTDTSLQSYPGRPHRDITRLKPGVGIILDLDAAATIEALELLSPTNDWQAVVYVADAPGETLAAWGDPVATTDGLPAGTNRIDLDGARGGAVLVWIVDRGDAPGRAPAEIQEARVLGS